MVRSTVRPLAVVAALVLVLAAGCGTKEEPAAPPATVPATDPPTTTTTTAPPATAPPVTAPVAAQTTTVIPTRPTQGYDAPDGTPTVMVTNKYYDRPTSLPVIDRRPGWLQVRLPQKPNGLTAWIRDDGVNFGTTPYGIVINLTTMHLQLYKDGEVVMDAPVGIGTDYTPTVTGDFFVTFNQPPPNASYGPFVMVTSGHSEVIQTWEGFPDGILAIHGPVGSDGLIGDTGVKISNGCIRMHLEHLLQLEVVPPGTPVKIVPA